MSLFKIFAPIIYILMNVINILDDNGRDKLLTVLAQLLWIGQSIAVIPTLTNHVELTLYYIGLFISIVGIPLTLIF